MKKGCVEGIVNVGDSGASGWVGLGLVGVGFGEGAEMCWIGWEEWGSVVIVMLLRVLGGRILRANFGD